MTRAKNPGGQITTLLRAILIPLAGAGWGCGQDDQPGGGVDAGLTAMVFVVEVPADTPSEDTVYLQSGPGRLFPMTRVTGRSWRVQLSAMDLAAAGAAPFGYAYTRGHGYIGGEFFPDDPRQEDWWHHRKVAPAPEQRDTVIRWRFFPEPGEVLPRYDVTPQGWLPREGGSFQAGLALADYFWAELAPLEGPANSGLKAIGANWILIAPPWDYASLDPIPVIGRMPEAPQYEDDELRAHIVRAKADGLKVLLEPQVCCSALDTRGRSPAWWDGWFAAYRAFFLHHARIANETGVDAMLFEGQGQFALPDTPGAPPDTAARWLALFADAHKEFKGPIGWPLLVHNAHDPISPPAPWGPAFASIAGGIDFLGVGFARGVGTGTSTAAELDANVEQMFAAKIDNLHRQTPLPIVLTGIGFGSYDGAATQEAGVFDVALTFFGTEREAAKVKWDGLEQAMIFDAFMKAVARRPYIIGTYSFHTNWVALPKAPDYSIRGKPAADVLRKWYALATGR
jgi:hypothetical protein